MVAALILSLCAAVAFVVTAQVVKTVYHNAFSAWSRIPSAGPFASFSRLGWLFPAEYRGTVTLDLFKLHQTLGPLIRIGPHEVSFYSINVYSTVFKVGSKFRKDPRVYGEFVQGQAPALFSITDPMEHSKRRRMMGQLYNQSKVDNLEQLMLHHISLWLDGANIKSNGFDVVPACRALEADIMSDFSFGTPIGAVDAWRKGEQLGMVAMNDEKATWMPVVRSISAPGHPVRIWENVEFLIKALTGWSTQYTHELDKFNKWADDSWSTALSPHAVNKSNTPNLIRTLVRSGLPASTALSEAQENLGPGTDTTSASLAHIIWALSHNEQYQDELHTQLLTAGYPTTIGSLERVPKLVACVKEGIRWAGAAAAMLPRIVPSGGVELQGTFLPEGTILYTSPIWYLRDPIAFPRPEYYDPYRWLTADGNALRADEVRDQYYLPFSKGPNVCIGRHFSYYEIYLSLTQIIQHYKIRRAGDDAPYLSPRTKDSKAHKWFPVKLPTRKEWVAACVTEELDIILEKRT